MVATDKLGRTWDGFLRLSKGERREFLARLKDWYRQRRIDAVASRGHHYPHRGPASFADLTLDRADLEPLAKPSLSEADLASFDLAE